MACWLGRFQSAFSKHGTGLDSSFPCEGAKKSSRFCFLGRKCVLRFDGGRLACVRDLPLDSVVCIWRVFRLFASRGAQSPALPSRSKFAATFSACSVCSPDIPDMCSAIREDQACNLLCASRMCYRSERWPFCKVPISFILREAFSRTRLGSNLANSDSAKRRSCTAEAQWCVWCWWRFGIPFAGWSCW